MEQIRKTVVGVYHVFGQQAKIAVIKSANAEEEIFVCDFLNGVEKVLVADRNVPFAQAPFELTDAEQRMVDLAPPKQEPKPKPKAKTAAKKSAPKGKAKK